MSNRCDQAYMLQKPILSGRIGKWAYALVEYDLACETLKSMRGQIVTDFIAEHRITTTHIGLCDVSFMSLNVVFSSFFIICYNCVTKIDWSPIPCHKRSSATKTYFFAINLMTIILSSLIYNTGFSSLKIYETSQNLVHR